MIYCYLDWFKLHYFVSVPKQMDFLVAKRAFESAHCNWRKLLFNVCQASGYRSMIRSPLGLKTVVRSALKVVMGEFVWLRAYANASQHCLEILASLRFAMTTPFCLLTESCRTSKI